MEKKTVATIKCTNRKPIHHGNFSLVKRISLLECVGTVWRNTGYRTVGTVWYTGESWAPPNGKNLANKPGGKDLTWQPSCEGLRGSCRWACHGCEESFSFSAQHGENQNKWDTVAPFIASVLINAPAPSRHIKARIGYHLNSSSENFSSFTFPAYTL